MRPSVFVMILSVLSLLAAGLVCLYSSSMAQAGAKYLKLQLVWAALGICSACLFAWIDYRKLKPFVVPAFLATAVMLVAVLIPGVGEWRNGSRRWFDLGVASLQPSELAKLAVIGMLAWYGERNHRQMGKFVAGCAVPLGLASMMMVLVLLEPDFGTTMLLGAVTLAVLLLSGTRLLWLAPVGVAGAAGLGGLIWLDPVRFRRIFSWLNVEETKEGVGHQAWQAMLAFGSGGVNGLGLGDGRQKLGFLPEHHTDFIFSIIGEELGLVATLGIVFLFCAFVLTGIRIATRAADVFGFLLGSGITLLIGLQALINIGVVTSALPNKGLPLPFISYGGSNLLLMLSGVGILMSIAWHGGQRASDPRVERLVLSPA